MRVLIVGGYGVFGSRLAHLLAAGPAVSLIIAGRRLAKAEAFCRTLPREATSIAARLDRTAPLEPQLRPLAPDVVVDASGPFQAYGQDPYRLVRAALAIGAHYLDLADDPAFIEGVSVFSAEAEAAGRVVLSGLSTVPALSGAAARLLADGMSRVDRVAVGIAPSPFAPFGASVVRGIARQAGRPARGGLGVSLVDGRAYAIAPPGVTPLRSRRFSLVQGLPSGLAEPAVAWVGAGTAPPILHGLLNGLARLVQWRLVPTLEPLTALFHWAANRLRWGEDRGGMFVEVWGVDAGRPAARSWELIAEGPDGPFIPAMAAAAVVTAIAKGSGPARGARSAAGALELADFEPFFAARAIVHGVRDHRP